MRHINFLAAGLCCMLIPAALLAEVVELRTDRNQLITANFLGGHEDINPVLILHGFLQTKEFPTVARLAGGMNDSGYTVLAPTLSLDVSNRKKSLACEAIHTHSMDTDAREIRQWVIWLKQKTGKPVTLIGHSSGSVALLNYLKLYGADDIDKFVLISLGYYAEGPLSNETPALAHKARQALARGANPLDSYALSFCKTYPTTARAFLSYYEWNRDQVAKYAKQYADKISTIIGSNDKRINPDWQDQLRAQGIRVLTVAGANHFFDQAHEFDLLDTVEASLAGDSR